MGGTRTQTRAATLPRKATRAPSRPATRAVARALRDAVRGVIVAHASLDDARRPCGTPLPLPHAWALLLLRERGPMRVSELAEELSIDRTNVSRLCARMEDAGDLSRTEQPGDKRAWRLVLTRKGLRAAAAVEASSTAHFADVLGRLDTRPGELVAALEALAAAMRATRGRRPTQETRE